MCLLTDSVVLLISSTVGEYLQGLIIHYSRSGHYLDVLTQYHFGTEQSLSDSRLWEPSSTIVGRGGNRPRLSTS